MRERVSTYKRPPSPRPPLARYRSPQDYPRTSTQVARSARLRVTALSWERRRRRAGQRPTLSGPSSYSYLVRIGLETTNLLAPSNVCLLFPLGTWALVGCSIWTASPPPGRFPTRGSGAARGSGDRGLGRLPGASERPFCLFYFPCCFSTTAVWPHRERKTVFFWYARAAAPSKLARPSSHKLL